MPIIIAIIAAIALIGAGWYFFSGTSSTPESITPDVETNTIVGEEFIVPSQSDETEVVATTPDTSRPAEEEVTMSNGTAGTFTASGRYLTPARTNHEIDVTLTINAAGIITAADVVYDGGDGFSNPNQERFDNAYSTLVIGQSIDTVSLSRVGGASLTSRAFNDAVAEIRAERG